MIYSTTTNTNGRQKIQVISTNTHTMNNITKYKTTFNFYDNEIHVKMWLISKIYLIEENRKIWPGKFKIEKADNF